MADNLFATVLTYPAPSSNYRGESEQNRTILQKITRNNLEYTVISPAAMRNALREALRQKGLPSNRSRRHDEDQLAVQFSDYPDPKRFADDFLFGYLVADKKASKEMKKRGTPAKRDSVLRMNLAVALTPYRFNAMFHQSPKNVDSPWKNSANSALIHREVSHTAYQYPFALALGDCSADKAVDAPTWTRTLLRAIGQLNGVAGGHAQSYFEMAPRSIVLRLTPSLVAGFNTYGFDEDGSFPELARLNDQDLPPAEFWLGGQLVRDMNDETKARLKAAGTQLFDNPDRLLKAVADEALGDD